MSSAPGVAVTINPDLSVLPVRQVSLKVLMVEDNPFDHELVLHELNRSGFAIEKTLVRTAAEFVTQVRQERPEIVLADYNLGDWTGVEAVAILKQENLDIPVILVSGALGEVAAVECIKQGVTDYVLKDSLTRLPLVMRRALHEKELSRESKRAQRDLAAKVEELARSNEDLEQFAYVASHDLQEPLRMVATYAQLIEERYADKLDDNGRKYVGYAVDGAVRMQALIKDLLAFSRCGRPGMEAGPVDCNQIVQRVLVNLQIAITQSGAFILPANLPNVWGNSSQLEHVFQNLISNAIKFRGERPPRISIGAAKQDEEWAFSVEDNGIGVLPEFAETIFCVFKRLHTRTEYPGNGIGLSICKKIVERHGGRIWVASWPGPGTKICFTLPDAVARGEEKQP